MFLLRVKCKNWSFWGFEYIDYIGQLKKLRWSLHFPNVDSHLAKDVLLCLIICSISNIPPPPLLTDCFVEVQRRSTSRTHSLNLSDLLIRFALQLASILLNCRRVKEVLSSNRAIMPSCLLQSDNTKDTSCKALVLQLICLGLIKM